MADDEAEIRKFIAERGVTKCPPAAAAVLGESTPGWRRSVERRTERRKGESAKKAGKRLQSALAERISAPTVPSRERGR
jgi:hypothetical protein